MDGNTTTQGRYAPNVDRAAKYLLRAATPDGLIAKLDRPTTNTVRADRQTRYFNLTLPISESTLRLIDSVISEGTRIAADGKMLVVQGRGQDLDEVTALVERLNETASTRKSPFDSADPRSIETSFFFITLSLDKGRSSGNGAPLPAALKPIVDALSENGFYNPSLLAPLFVNVKEVTRGDDFEINGQAGDISIRVSGQGRLSGRPESIDMSVSANLRAPRVVGESTTVNGVESVQRAVQSIFDIATTLNVKLDDYVVLAAAPSSNGDGRAIALVVRATAGK